MDTAIQLANTTGLIIVAVITYLGNRQLHTLVNSRMSELLDLAKKNAKSEGKEEGRAEGEAKAATLAEGKLEATKNDKPIQNGM